MKYFITVIAEKLAFKETSDIARYLRQHGISMLLYLAAMLLGFDAAIALKLFAGMYILPLSAIFCASLFFFLFFSRIKGVTHDKSGCYLTSRRNPHEIDVADLLEREVVPLETSEALAVLK